MLDEESPVRDKRSSLFVNSINDKGEKIYTLTLKGVLQLGRLHNKSQTLGSAKNIFFCQWKEEKFI
jgi:hypothetical protein